MLSICITIGKGIIVLFLLLMLFELIDLLINKFSSGSFKILYDSFKDLIIQAIEYFLCIFIFSIAMFSVLGTFYILGIIF